MTATNQRGWRLSCASSETQDTSPLNILLLVLCKVLCIFLIEVVTNLHFSYKIITDDRGNIVKHLPFNIPNKSKPVILKHCGLYLHFLTFPDEYCKKNSCLVFTQKCCLKTKVAAGEKEGFMIYSQYIGLMLLNLMKMQCCKYFQDDSETRGYHVITALYIHMYGIWHKFVSISK